MATTSNGRWRILRFRYSLSTLFLITAALAVCLGYQVERIRERHEFLAEQRARNEASWGGQHGPLEEYEINFCVQRDAGWPPPWPLALFGEKGVTRIYLMIPDHDIRDVIVPTPDGYGEYTQPEMDASQRDLVHAKRLFPEAEIHPIHWENYIPTDGTARAFHEIEVR